MSHWCLKGKRGNVFPWLKSAIEAGGVGGVVGDGSSVVGLGQRWQCFGDDGRERWLGLGVGERTSRLG